MLKKLKSLEEIAMSLANEGMVQKALDFIGEHQGQLAGLKLSTFLEQVEELKAEGLTMRADLVLRRI